MAQAVPFTPPRYSARRVRLLSGLALAATLLGTLTPMLLPIDGSGAVMTVTRLLGWVLALSVTVGSPGWRYVRPGELDERERAERARALVISHRVSGILIGIAFIWLLASGTGRLWLPTLAQGSWLMGLVYWLHCALPATILAWREPNEEEL
jgi:hypothetical protein